MDVIWHSWLLIRLWSDKIKILWTIAVHEKKTYFTTNSSSSDLTYLIDTLNSWNTSEYYIVWAKLNLDSEISY